MGNTNTDRVLKVASLAQTSRVALEALTVIDVCRITRPLAELRALHDFRVLIGANFDGAILRQDTIGAVEDEARLAHTALEGFRELIVALRRTGVSAGRLTPDGRRVGAVLVCQDTRVLEKLRFAFRTRETLVLVEEPSRFAGTPRDALPESKPNLVSQLKHLQV